MSKRRLLEASANRADVFIDETHLTGQTLVHKIEDCDPYIKQARSD